MRREVRRLRLSRCSRAFRPGCVGTRFFSGIRALAIQSLILRRASSRFRLWSRLRWLVAISLPELSSLCRTALTSLSLLLSSSPWTLFRSTRSSTLEATLLTFCPPGPEARTARISKASAGTITSARTTIGSGMYFGVHGFSRIRRINRIREDP